MFEEVIENIHFVSHKGGPIIVNDLRSCINATIMGLVVKNLFCTVNLNFISSN